MAEAHSYSPREVDRLGLRDLGIMVHAAIRQQRDRWKRAAHMSAMIYNMGGPRAESFTPKSAEEIMPEPFGKPEKEWEQKMQEIPDEVWQ